MGKSHDVNPLPDLVELKTALSPHPEHADRLQLITSLRVHPFEYDEPELGNVTISITRAFVSLNASGLSILEATKFGQPVARPQTSEIEQEKTETSSRQKGRSGEASIGAAGAGIGGLFSTTKGSESGQTFRTKSSVGFQPILAVGNDNWKIHGLDGAALDAVYVPSAALCELSIQWGSNIATTSTQVYVKQKDIRTKFDSDSGIFSFLRTPNEKKIAGILLAKSLHRASGQSNYGGVLIFAESTAEDEG